MSNVVMIGRGGGRHRKGDLTPRQRSLEEVIDDLKDQLAGQWQINTELLTTNAALLEQVAEMNRLKRELRDARERVHTLEDAIAIERQESERYRGLLGKVDAATTQTQLRLLADPVLGRPTFNPQDETMGIDVKALRDAYRAEPPTAEIPIVPPVPTDPPTVHLAAVKPIKPIKPDLANTIPAMGRGFTASIRIIRQGDPR